MSQLPLLYLRLRLEKMLLEELLPSLRQNPGQIAVTGIEAILAERGKFSYKDYYTRALEALKEVLIEYKVDYGFPSDAEKDSGWLSQAYCKDAPALRRAMEKVFRYRQLKRKLPPSGGNFRLKPKFRVKLSFWLSNLHGYITS